MTKTAFKMYTQHFEQTLCTNSGPTLPLHLSLAIASSLLVTFPSGSHSSLHRDKYSALELAQPLATVNRAAGNKGETM